MANDQLAIRNADGTKQDVNSTAPLPVTIAGTTSTSTATNGLNSTGTGIQATQLVAQVDESTQQSITENNFGNVRMSGEHILYAASAPTSGAGAGVTNATTSVAGGSVVAKASGGNLYGVNYVAGASAGFLMLFNSASVPADGTVTPVKCIPVAANAGGIIEFTPPVRFGTGITAVFSTTGPFTKTISATAFISVDYL